MEKCGTVALVVFQCCSTSYVPSVLIIHVILQSLKACLHSCVSRRRPPFQLYDSERLLVAHSRRLREQAEKTKGASEPCTGLDEAGNDLGDITPGFFLRQVCRVTR